MICTPARTCSYHVFCTVYPGLETFGFAMHARCQLKHQMAEDSLQDWAAPKTDLLVGQEGSQIRVPCCPCQGNYHRNCPVGHHLAPRLTI